MFRARAVLGGPLMAVAMAAAGCGGPADARSAGSACFRATECSAGLVCIDRVCTADLTSVDLRRDGGSEASIGTRAGEAMADGAGLGSADDASSLTTPGPISDAAFADVTDAGDER